MTLPPPDDFVSTWSDLGDRMPEILRNLETLISTPDQLSAVCTWLLVQLFSGHMSDDAFPVVFSQAAKLAYRFVPESSDMVRACGLSENLPSQLSIMDRSIVLETPEQRGNLSNVAIMGSRITIEKGGPNSVQFVECLFDNVQFDVNGPTKVDLLRCYIPELHISLSEEGQLTLRDCIYDEDHVVLPKNASLVDCNSAKIKAKIYLAYALASVLAKFITLNASKPETSMRKTNINEENVFTGIVAHYIDASRRIVAAMVRLGYLSKKPTGSVTRYDPTGSFNAHEGAKFIMSPHPQGVGPMTKDILSKIS